MRHRHCFIFLLAVILIFCCYILSLERELLTFGLRHKNLNVGVDDGIRRERTNCTLATCLDLLACFVRDDRLTVYVEPLISVYDQGNDIAPIVSKEFIEIRTAILQSEFSVDDPNDACLVLPGFDTLSMRRFADGAATLRKLLTAENRFARHNILMFVFAGQTIAAEKAIIARSQSFLSNFRYGFDVSIPMWVPYPSHYPPDVIPYKRKYLISVVLRYASKTARKTLLDVFGNREDIIFYEECPSKQKMESVCARDGKDVPINRALMVGNFTIIYDRIPAFELVLVHSFRANSIPVVISDSFVLPFDDVIAWDSYVPYFCLSFVQIAVLNTLKLT
ncbi:hypothetical protein AB6A40_001101 [Gnathostoma spinigerum]|uniref:Exostosin GT47 domain-containing protein n=1 Tax=Gnathostoma spinigerum TaxID=75299 RepID=A0ABD6ED18_9BILA